MALVMSDLLADLKEETRVVDEMIAPLGLSDWERATPAEGWAIRDQVSHLAFFDEAATLSAVDSDRFAEQAKALMARGPAFPDRIAEDYRSMPVPELLAWFRSAREDMVERFAQIDPKLKVPWYGPPMSAASSITARLMETWAHGQDIADTVGVEREPSARLRHVAHIGVRTYGFSFTLRDKQSPEAPVRVELIAPDGSEWTWGPKDAVDKVRGPALDFCLVVTQRRHLADTTLQVTGPAATEWMSIAQAFAGSPGPGRSPLGSTA